MGVLLVFVFVFFLFPLSQWIWSLEGLSETWVLRPLMCNMTREGLMEAVVRMTMQLTAKRTASCREAKKNKKQGLVHTIHPMSTCMSAAVGCLSRPSMFPRSGLPRALKTVDCYRYHCYCCKDPLNWKFEVGDLKPRARFFCIYGLSAVSCCVLHGYLVGFRAGYLDWMFAWIMLVDWALIIAMTVCEWIFLTIDILWAVGQSLWICNELFIW